MSVQGTHKPRLEFDQDGFLKDPAAWNHDLAEQMAQQSGFDGLTPEQWRILHWLRDHYFETGAPPSAHQVCHENQLEHDCIGRVFRHDLRGAWRIAGLPNPGEEAKTYM